MAVPTRWTVDHACGHRREEDLEARRPDRRAGYARWLAGRPCRDCWQAVRADEHAERRAAELDAARRWAEQNRMPPLDGSPKAAPWAERCRHQLLTAAHTALVAEGELSEEEFAQVEDAARTVTRAGWWIDQRDADGADLPELLAGADGTDRGCENPY